jgi:starch synthase (maltosyl-transferring)
MDTAGAATPPTTMMGREAPEVPPRAPTAPKRRIGRIPVQDVAPLVDCGNRPVKSVVEEPFAVTATVFREGHDAVNANIVLTDPGGDEQHLPMVRINTGLDLWSVTISADRTGRWSYR